jgi:UDP-N-acetylmuramyl pentapeptide synthase
LKDKKLILKHFRSRKSLSGFLRNLDLMNSIILVKGSRGMQMEEFSKIISGRMKN